MCCPHALPLLLGHIGLTLDAGRVETQSRICLKTNPHTLPGITSFLAVLQANGRGYWDTSEENLERLRQLYTDVEVRPLGFTPSVHAHVGWCWAAM